VIVLHEGGVEADRGKIERIATLGEIPPRIADAVRHEDSDFRRCGFEDLRLTTMRRGQEYINGALG
jgi:hypothetical protein